MDRLARHHDLDAVEDFAVTVQPGRESVLVRLSGELDIATARELEGTISDVLSSGSGRIIVDLADLTFLDSSGICALVRGRDSAAAGGAELSIRNARGAAARTLQICGLVELTEGRAGSPPSLRAAS